MKLKKVLLLSVALLLAFSAGAAAATGITIKVNGQTVDVDVKVINGTTYLPLRAIGEILGAQITYDAKTKTVNVVTAPGSSPGSEDNEDGIYRVGNISFLNFQAEKTDFGWDVIVEIKNNDTKDYQGIIFTATFYDANGKIIGTATGSVLDLKKGESKTVTMLTTDELDGYEKVKFQIDLSY